MILLYCIVFRGNIFGNASVPYDSEFLTASKHITLTLIKFIKKGWANIINSIKLIYPLLVLGFVCVFRRFSSPSRVELPCIVV